MVCRYKYSPLALVLVGTNKVTCICFSTTFMIPSPFCKIPRQFQGNSKDVSWHSQRCVVGSQNHPIYTFVPDNYMWVEIHASDGTCLWPASCFPGAAASAAGFLLPCSETLPAAIATALPPVLRSSRQALIMPPENGRARKWLLLGVRSY